MTDRPIRYVSPAQRGRDSIRAMSQIEFDVYVTGMSVEAVTAAHRARARLEKLNR